MIKYVKVKRDIHVGQNPGERYVARLFRNLDLTLDDIAATISNSTTISYADVLATLKALEIEISKAVLNGSAVKLGYLGSFVPTIRAKSQLDADKVDATTITRFTCRFMPSVSFKHTLSKVKYQEADLEVKGMIE
ncbi:MAG: HU family DNA-binding protein [Bacteroidales bacterium]|jgi:predicted histone-like DNA-binding protein|nr:HU family DNA-binding protein [Bacteroidales bacterium]MBQ2396348.1 HU family DNA-binding protein [Bacteroidales bacterium]MBQ5873900.1 HU family DNA-binding protein [Bacteroidales bacterium]MBQ5891941.1 HU family DNA-binding protein [Bacteroidales bacterium]MED9962099.1 HU family DNA-binding protein [Bacteroidales bacterium]